MSTELSTSRLTEDIQADQKKVVYRGSFAPLTASDLGTADGDGFYNVTLTESLSKLKATELVHEIVYVYDFGSSSSIFQNQYRLAYPAANYDAVYSYIASSSGSLNLIVKIRTSVALSDGQSIRVYYIIYSTLSTNEAIL